MPAATILIIGGGTFGLSTAYHLALRNHENITCLDKYYFPSPDSAGYDINKMLRTEYSGSTVMQHISKEAVDAWRENKLFKPFFHETGRISLASSEVGVPEVKELYEELRQEHVPHRDKVRWVEGEEDIRQVAPYLTGKMSGWKAVYNPEGGWVHAKDAMEAVGRECIRMGVKFVHGDKGTVARLIRDEKNGNIRGVQSVDDTVWTADKIVLAVGAWADTLVDLKGQLVAKTWTLGHVKITDPEERKALKDIPVTFDVEKGFFFEPSQKNGMIKICNEFPGFTYYQSIPISNGGTKTVSVPRGHGSHPTDTIPTRSKNEIHALLQSLKPEWSHLPLYDTKMCWCTDTPDRHYLITFHPEYAGTLILASGASGHGFKMLPVVGKYVADLVEGNELPSMMRDAWKWRPEMNGERPGDESRPGVGGDLNDEDVGGWKGIDSSKTLEP